MNNVNYQLQDMFLEVFFSSKFGNQFYLSGGTALSRFYFNHRESVDLDLFTQDQKIDFNEVNLEMVKIIDKLRLATEKQVTTDTFLQYICKSDKGVILKIDCVKDVPIRFGDVISKGKIRIDSLENIGSNKVLAIFGRTDAKDFIDLYIILQKTGRTFNDFYNMAAKKDLGLDYFYFANSISNIDKVEIWPSLKIKLDVEKVKSYYKNLSVALFKKIKPKE